jgi:hypothetical protein
MQSSANGVVVAVVAFMKVMKDVSGGMCRLRWSDQVVIPGYA